MAPTRYADLRGAVAELVKIWRVVNATLGDVPHEPRGQLTGAVRGLAELAGAPMCDIDWCTNKYPDHGEHRYDNTLTASTGEESISVGVGVEPAGTYEEEIRVCVTNCIGDEAPELAVIYLDEDQARQIIAAIELAVERRARIRKVAGPTGRGGQS